MACICKHEYSAISTITNGASWLNLISKNYSFHLTKRSLIVLFLRGTTLLCCIILLIVRWVIVTLCRRLSSSYYCLIESQFSRPNHSNNDFYLCCRCNSSKHPVVRILWHSYFSSFFGQLDSSSDTQLAYFILVCPNVEMADFRKKKRLSFLWDLPSLLKTENFSLKRARARLLFTGFY